MSKPQQSDSQNRHAEKNRQGMHAKWEQEKSMENVGNGSNRPHKDMAGPKRKVQTVAILINTEAGKVKRI